MFRHANNVNYLRGVLTANCSFCRYWREKW